MATRAAPRLLDLFCGAGGAAVGYHRAGFEVVGVDIEDQPNYPFEFHRADALTYPLDGFDVVHASPPCQAYSAAMAHFTDGRHPELLDPVRARLRATGRPWVIENVVGAPLPFSFVLCGSMFDLPVRRHRLFETDPFLLVPPHRHRVDDHPVVITGGRLSKALRAERPWTENVTSEEAKAAMGIGWMTRDELSQAIPPAYTEWIGGQLLSVEVTA